MQFSFLVHKSNWRDYWLLFTHNVLLQEITFNTECYFQSLNISVAKLLVRNTTWAHRAHTPYCTPCGCNDESPPQRIYCSVFNRKHQGRPNANTLPPPPLQSIIIFIPILILWCLCLLQLTQAVNSTDPPPTQLHHHHHIFKMQKWKFCTWHWALCPYANSC